MGYLKSEVSMKVQEWQIKKILEGKTTIPRKNGKRPFPWVPAIKIPEEWRVEDGRKTTNTNTP